jgi:hypothetical protein
LVPVAVGFCDAVGDSESFQHFSNEFISSQTIIRSIAARPYRKFLLSSEIPVRLSFPLCTCRQRKNVSACIGTGIKCDDRIQRLLTPNPLQPLRGFHHYQSSVALQSSTSPQFHITVNCYKYFTPLP